MAPIKTSISTAKVAPTSSVSENILFSSCPSTAVLESTLSNSSLPRPLIDTLLVLTILYIIIPHIYNWRYPVQSAQGLRRLTLSVERSIQKVGGKHGLNLKERLWEINDRITALKARIEPPRSSLFAWIAFKWDMLKEVDVCYVALKKLECEAQAKPQCVGEGNLEGEQCAGTSAVEAGESARRCAATSNHAPVGLIRREATFVFGRVPHIDVLRFHIDIPLSGPCYSCHLFSFFMLL
ncbi:hypothetical protein WG66_012977 [Moniliophthora roreri]|nr:hypothetical protein WG66_012977 [Moniliophthora roreri]